MGKRVPRPSPAMVVALLALCLAVGGTAFAATKLGKNAVKTKNIKNGAVKASKLAANAVTESKIAGNAVTEGKIAGNAVTEGKIANGAVSAGKLGASAKTAWVETDLGSASDIVAQSGGVTITPTGTDGEVVVDFGTNVSNRAITVTSNLNLGSVTTEYARCTRVECPSAENSPNAILVIIWGNSSSPDLVNSGFLAAALP
jgi:hypothetical protein